MVSTGDGGNETVEIINLTEVPWTKFLFAVVSSYYSCETISVAK